MRRLIASMAVAALLSGPVVAAPASVMAAGQDGLVNVYVGNVEVAKDVNAGVAAQVVASVCADVNANVNALASQVDQTSLPQTITCPSTGAPIRIAQN